jgi:hypothetical protein
LLFRAEEHRRRWCKDWNRGKGASLSLETTWRLAQAWYAADRRAPEWRRFSPGEAEAVFAGVGLAGPFWQLLKH